MRTQTSFTIYFIALATVFATMTLRSSPIPEKTWGVYQIHWGSEKFELGIQQQIKLLGAQPDHIMFFRDLNARRGFPTESVELCHRYGAIPVISQELWMWGQRDASNRSWLKRIITGEYDNYWQEWARLAKAFDQTVILRFGFEMNGDWFAWGQQPEDFIAAWRRVYSIVRGAGAEKVRFMFSPNVEWDSNKPLTSIELYYPGDAYVDLLGLDGYNFGDSHSEWHQWQSYSEVFEESIAKISQWPQPLYLAEIGCADGPRKAEWIEDFLKRLERDPRLSGFIYFNHFDPKKGEPDWRINSDSGSLSRFLDYLNIRKNKS